MKPKDIMIEASKAVKSKNLILAVELYNELLNKFPNHSGARSGLKKIKRITSPYTNGISQTELNEAVSALQIGSFQKAIDLAKKLILKDPNIAIIYNIIGISYVNLQTPEKAILNFTTALRLEKNYNEARGNLGSALLLIGNVDEAIVQIEQALKENPKNSMAWNSLGNAKDQKLQYQDALLAFRKAIEITPNYINAYNSLGVLLNKLNDKDEADKVFKKGLSLSPNDTDLLINYGYLLGEQGKLTDAIDNISKGLQSNQYPIDAKHRLGNLKSNNGDIKGAIALIEEAINEDPSLSEAYRSLSLIYKFKKSDKLIETMKKRLMDSSATTYDHAHLGFALGKSLHDIKKYDEAFEAYKIGNRARRSELNYDSKEHSASIEKIKLIYSENKQTIIDKRVENTVPIFIVGMNRSGTTLVEQILSSHSYVTGAGELPNINNAGLDNLKKNSGWTSSELLNTSLKYSKVLNEISNKTKFVTDKLPVNFKWIGLIKKLYPDAKIIHVIRDPMDTCLSNYRNYFTATGNAYAYNQEELARFFLDYRNLMDFWYNMFPNQIYACDYNFLTLNQETETRSLLNYCDLNWEPQVLKFEANKRVVKTASVAQVREGIYRTSIGGWEHYKNHLISLHSVLQEGNAFRHWDKTKFA